MDIHANRLTNKATISTFMLAGNARFTLRSVATGKRFTFKVRKPKAQSPWFVSVLTDSDNESSYTFMGTIFDTAGGAEYKHSYKGGISREAPCAVAFNWFWKHMCAISSERPDLPDGVEFWHEGRCGKCGRALTVPESIESGFGPECIKMMAEGS